MNPFRLLIVEQGKTFQTAAHVKVIFWTGSDKEKPMLNKLENAMNWLSDQDWGWWPFLHLRPKKDEAMSTPDVARMSFYYGIPLGLTFYLIFRDFQWFLAGIVLFFVLFRFTFAIAWNRRAKRLRNQ